VEAIIDLLRGAGRRRYLATTADKIYHALHTEHLQARTQIAEAYGASTRALVSIVTELSHQIDVVQGQVVTHFGRHPDGEIYLSQPGLGVVLATRVLAEFGDASGRYTDSKARRNYAGTSPITRASGINQLNSYQRLDTSNVLSSGVWGVSLATGSCDRTVRLWRMDVKQAIQRICTTTTNTRTPAKWEQYVSS
jgi:hypothetical protein